MATAKKTHTLTFYPMTETPDPTTRIVPVPQRGTGVGVQGQLTPISSEQVFRDTGMELTNPHLFLCDLEPVSTVPIKPNMQAEDVGGVVYAVRGKPRRWNAIPVQSFGEVYLEELGVQPS
jgi:hypothetical protein